MSLPMLAAGLFLLVCLVGADSGPVWPIPSDLWKPLPGSTPLKGNFVYLNSQPGDYVGGGLNYSYTPLNAMLSFTQTAGLLEISVQSNEDWTGYFEAMSSLTGLEPGYYGDVEIYPYNNASVGGLNLYRNEQDCNDVTGWFAVDDVAYKEGNLTFISLRFEQHCEGESAALRGAVQWDINDHQKPNGPTKPPRGLWTPPKSATFPGNYMYLESHQGDSVGGGLNYSYTSSNAIISINTKANDLSVVIKGNQGWLGEFKGMSSIQQLEKGYYGELQSTPFNNPALAGMSWEYACSSMSGWFVVDEIAYNSTGLICVQLRFSQQCNEATAALFGALSWSAKNPSNPPGPINPPPKGLWTPPKAAISSGNYVYLESQQGDWVGGGQNYSYNSSNALFSINTKANSLFVAINGNQQWKGEFQGMSSVQQLAKGYYGEIQLYPFNNPVLAGFSWGNCYNSVSGWFVVDEIAYNSTGLVSVTLRFAQHCRDATPALYGALSWSAKNPASPPGPVNPPPINLWSPAKYSVPSAGNYVYLESEPGDHVGGGQNYTYTSTNSTILISNSNNLIYVAVNSNNEYWYGDFQAMQGLAELEVGYYGGLQRYPYNNPVLGGLYWRGCACNTISGWFVVDVVEFAGGVMCEIQLRFEQHCEEAVPALHGAVSWKASTSLF